MPYIYIFHTTDVVYHMFCYTLYVASCVLCYSICYMIFVRGNIMYTALYTVHFMLIFDFGFFVLCIFYMFCMYSSGYKQ